MMKKIIKNDESIWLNAQVRRKVEKFFSFQLFFLSLEGQIIESDEDVIVENVPVVTPTGDIIVENLSLKVRLDLK